MNRYNDTDFSIIIPSCRHKMATDAAAKIHQYKCDIVDGTNATSFSSLINQCIIGSKTEVIIIMNDKVRASADDIDRMIRLLDDGFGLVSMYLFGFFAFSKELIRHIGFFDQNFTSGGFEDVDFQNRLIEADIATYKTTEVKYIECGSSWKPCDNKSYYDRKWKEDFANNKLIRLKVEDSFYYDIGPMKNKAHELWKSHKYSILPGNNRHLMEVEVCKTI